MEPQQPHHSRPSHPLLQNFHFPSVPQLPPRNIASTATTATANSTPASSPGLFNPANPRSTMSLQSQGQQSEGSVASAVLDNNNNSSPYLHPLQGHKVRETHKANVDTDFTTGRKLINHYEIIDELGRGMHGKVKLARNLQTGENVAIKIIPRFSKKRRLGKVTAMSTQDKSKKEIAILKKIRHPNVVGLIEIIDDPELKKIYMVLEHVELGEIVWRKKGLPSICGYERRRVEREMSGREPTPEEESYDRSLERRQALREIKMSRMRQAALANSADYWSFENGGNFDEDDVASLPRSLPRGDDHDAAGSTPSESCFVSRATSRAPSRNQSQRSLYSMRQLSRTGTPQPYEKDLPPLPDDDDLETPGAGNSVSDPYNALDGTMFGPYVEDFASRGRSPSMADSIVSHMSSVDYRVHDPFADDFSYVPCFTFDKAKQTFRDTVLGLEYLHYEGIIHRDIKPANLLWTRDQRVKISDFGVSYFGRPIRDGEPDETISESEARDFDNDLELAKTVGTPAFFAPELCYTEPFDSDGRPRPQPKVNEQIDVWSLGVTLYCLIFARIPFLGEDEWQMFRKIATEEVYIPTKRLAPVYPATKPDESSLFTRVNPLPYRNDDELRYEFIEPELRDLLSKMLTKNPERRIRLRDVKRHPWVLKGINDVAAWLDDTDPSRRTLGRKIQVDEREMARAVVPISIIERARSAVKKTFGKVMHRDRGDRAEGSSSSRRRAASSAASSSGDIPAGLGTATPHVRDMRRRSLRPDDYFHAAFHSQQQQQGSSEHPLTQSVTATSPGELGDPDGLGNPGDFGDPGDAPQDGDDASSVTHHSSVSVSASASASASAPAPAPAPAPAVGAHHSNTRQLPDVPGDFNSSDDTDRQAPTPSPRPAFRHSHARSVTNAILSLAPSFRDRESFTVPSTPLYDHAHPLDDPIHNSHINHNFNNHTTPRKARDVRSAADELSRARSVDRGFFTNSDKHGGATVSLSNAIAPGSVHRPPRLESMRSADLMRGLDASSSSPLGSPLGSSAPPHSFLSCRYQHGQPKSDPNMHVRQRSAADIVESPRAIHRIHDWPEAKTPPPRVYNSSTPESFARAHEHLIRRHVREHEEQLRRQQMMDTTSDTVVPAGEDGDEADEEEVGPALIPCPPSPDDEVLSRPSLPNSRQETIASTAISSSSTSMAGFTTPLTSPSETASPFCLSNPVPSSEVVDHILTFQSDPSLPALLSGASSVSADPEGEFLNSPGVVNNRSSVIDTTDSLTPPALTKEPIAGFPLEAQMQHEQEEHGAVAVELVGGVARPPLLASSSSLRVPRRQKNDDDDESDSDEGLTMMRRSSKKGHAKHASLSGKTVVFGARRRDTNISIASTDTAKKVAVDNSD